MRRTVVVWASPPSAFPFAGFGAGWCTTTTRRRTYRWRRRLRRGQEGNLGRTKGWQGTLGPPCPPLCLMKPLWRQRVVAVVAVQGVLLMQGAGQGVDRDQVWASVPVLRVPSLGEPVLWAPGRVETRVNAVA